MRGRPAHVIGRALAAVALSGAAILAYAVPSQAATAKYWEASESLHNGAQLVIMDSVKLSNGKWRDVGPALTISQAVGWPGHPAFGGQYRVRVYTPGNVRVVQAHIQSWISNSGVPYQDPTGSGDTVTLKQHRQC